jgi:hypothetical protein
MIQRCLVIFTRDFSEVFAGRVDSQYFVGSDFFFGHSIKSHSSEEGQAECQLLHRNGLMFRIALQTLGGRTPTWSSCRRRQRLLSRSAMFFSTTGSYHAPSLLPSLFAADFKISEIAFRAGPDPQCHSACDVSELQIVD